MTLTENAIDDTIFDMDADQILTELEAERKKYPWDREKMQVLVNLLLELGVYKVTPTMEKYDYTALQMVEGWGARWHEFGAPLACPSCGADWRNHETGPPFKREIGIYSQGQDRTVAWRCPDCGAEFPR